MDFKLYNLLSIQRGRSHNAWHNVCEFGVLVYLHLFFSTCYKDPSLSWSYVSWIFNYLCNQFPLPLKLWVRIPLRQDVPHVTLCYKVCPVTCWFSPCTPVSSANKTDRQDIAEIMLKVELCTTIVTPALYIHRYI